MSPLQNTICRKVRNPFHIRLNKHKKDIRNPNAIKACPNFYNLNHVFHRHGKLRLIKQPRNIKNTSTEVLKQRQRELLDKKTKSFNIFWIKSRTKLTPWHAVLLLFTIVPSLCIWIKHMTLVSLGDVK